MNGDVAICNYCGEKADDGKYRFYRLTVEFQNQEYGNRTGYERTYCHSCIVFLHNEGVYEPIEKVAAWLGIDR